MISGWTWMLDTVPKEGEKNSPTLSYEDEETDPLLIYNKADACVICRGVDFGTPLIKWHRYFGRFGTKRGMKDRNLRLVIGPDLVAEKMSGKK